MGLMDPITFDLRISLTYSVLKKADKYLASSLSPLTLIMAQNDGTANPSFSFVTYVASYGVDSLTTTSPSFVNFSSSIFLQICNSPKFSFTIIPSEIAFGARTLTVPIISSSFLFSAETLGIICPTVILATSFNFIYITSQCF